MGELDRILRNESEPRLRTWRLGNQVVRVERHFGDEISVELDGQTAVPARPARTFGVASVALPSGETAEITVRSVPLNAPDVVLRVRGRSVPDDAMLAEHRCARCRAPLGALDETCSACGTPAHDFRASLLEGRLYVARAVLGTFAALFAVVGVALAGTRVAPRIPLALQTTGILSLAAALIGLWALARTRPLPAFLAALVIVVPVLVAANVVVRMNSGLGLLSLLSLLALYRGAKAAFASRDG